MPNISGCRVQTKTPTRQSGSPTLTQRSHACAIISFGPGAERAPSIIQSTMVWKATLSMTFAFAAQVAERSSRQQQQTERLWDRRTETGT
jgi:hypothetical protein